MSYTLIKGKENYICEYMTDEGYIVDSNKYDMEKGKAPSIFGNTNRHHLDENIPLYLSLNNKDCEYIKWFIGKHNKTIIRFKCSCGVEFDYPISNLMNSQKDKKTFKCQRCTVKQRGLKKRKNKDIIFDFNKEGLKVLTDKKDVYASQPILVENKEGYKGYVYHHNVCRKKQNIAWLNYNTAKEFLVDNINIRLKEIGVDSVCLSAGGSNEHMVMKCSCGNIYCPLRVCVINNHSGQRCPECTKSLSSYELIVKNYLDSIGVEYEQQKKFDTCRNKHCLPFDFYIIGKNVLIEVQGEQHYRDVFKSESFNIRKKNDEYKKHWCEDNGYELIEIKYDEIKNNSYKQKIDSIF